MTIAFPKPTKADRTKRHAGSTRGLAFQKDNFDRDAEFRRFVSGHPCLLSAFKNHECGGVTEFSHMTTGGTSVKGSDYFGVPLCTNHHTAAPGAFHRLGSVQAFESTHGVNLWRENAALLAEWLRRRKG